MENQEKKIINDIKKMAKEGQMVIFPIYFFCKSIFAMKFVIVFPFNYS